MQYQLRKREEFSHIAGYWQETYSLWYMKPIFGFKIWRRVVEYSPTGEIQRATGDRLWARRIAEELKIDMPKDGSTF